MACFSCKQLQVWGSCVGCSAKLKAARQIDEIQLKCKAQLEEEKSDLELYQLKLTFLRLQFESEPADEIERGDIEIVLQGRRDEPIFAHKFILSSRSSVFSKMFNSKMLEGQTGIVHIDDSTLPVMRAVIKFCYDAEITFTDEVTCEDVLVVANKYHISLLHKICEEHLIKSLNNRNLPKRLRLAKRFEAAGLEAAASKHFKKNFDSVISDVLIELC